MVLEFNVFEIDFQKIRDILEDNIKPLSDNFSKI